MANDDHKTLDPLESLLSEPGPLPPIGPDGAFRPATVYDPIKIPDATPENFVCLRGPCVHYWEHLALMPAGNTSESLDGKPVKIKVRECTFIKGVEYDLTDSNVFDCNQWDPKLAGDVQSLNIRREQFYQINPNLRPKPEVDEDDED